MPENVFPVSYIQLRIGIYMRARFETCISLGPPILGSISYTPGPMLDGSMYKVSVWGRGELIIVQ